MSSKRLERSALNLRVSQLYSFPAELILHITHGLKGVFIVYREGSIMTMHVYNAISGFLEICESRYIVYYTIHVYNALFLVKRHFVTKHFTEMPQKLK